MVFFVISYFFLNLLLLLFCYTVVFVQEVQNENPGRMRSISNESTSIVDLKNNIVGLIQCQRLYRQLNPILISPDTIQQQQQEQEQNFNRKSRITAEPTTANDDYADYTDQPNNETLDSDDHHYNLNQQQKRKKDQLSSSLANINTFCHCCLYHADSAENLNWVSLCLASIFLIRFRLVLLLLSSILVILVIIMRVLLLVLLTFLFFTFYVCSFDV